MAKEQKPSWIEYLKGATKKKHSKAGREYIKSMIAQGKKWTGTKWVDTMATKGVENRLHRSVTGKPISKKKVKEIEGTHLSKQSKRQLSRLGKEDYKEMMKAMKR